MAEIIRRKTLRISNLHCENWRNFLRVDVPIQRRVCWVGPNASGKSNFLDVFWFLHDIVSIGGGFRDAVRRRGGVSRLRCLAARRYPDIVLRINFIELDTESDWEYSLHFNQDNRQRPIVKEERVLRKGKLLLSRPDDEDRSDPER